MVVPGVPNSGKSEWLDALLVNLAYQYGWCFAFCSLEKRPRDHARQLLEKVVGQPFFSHYAATKPRMTWPQVEGGLQFIDEHFHIIRHDGGNLEGRGEFEGFGRADAPADGGSPTIDWILEKARSAVMR